jgi:hypothetical protein
MLITDGLKDEWKQKHSSLRLAFLGLSLFRATCEGFHVPESSISKFLTCTRMRDSAMVCALLQRAITDRGNSVLSEAHFIIPAQASMKPTRGKD